MENNEQLNIISPLILRRRVEQELKLLINEGYLYNILHVNICEEYDNIYNEKFYKLFIYNNKDLKLYEFTIYNNYPFVPPKLRINHKSYYEYQLFKTEYFRDALFKHKGLQCLCCESILCYSNWAPRFTLKHIFEEVNKFRKYCREISHRVIVNVVKRKYLNNDINIIEWLYR